MRTINTLVLLSLLFPALLQAQANKVAGEITEHAIGPIAKEVAEQTAKELVANAGATISKEVAASATKKLSEAIVAHGIEVANLARRVPEATEVLARNAQNLLPLAKQLGDDILRVEARAPGFAEMASKNYGKEALPRLLNLSEQEMKGVLVAATHTVEPRAAQLILEGTEKGGMGFLGKISGTQIVATGLSVAAIMAVMGIEEKIPAGQETVKTLGDSATKLLSPITMVLAALLATWGGLAIWRRHRRS